MQIIHIKQRNRKTYSLHFDFNGNLVVKTDIKFFGSKLDEILKRHSQWIKLNFKRFREQLAITKQDYIKDGFEYKILGESFKIKYSILNSEYFTIKFENADIHITQPLNGKFNKSRIKIELKEFFRQVAREYLTSRVSVISDKMNLKFNRIFIKNQKTKWGSCSSEKNLNFNWHLIFAPKEVIDYVIIHELSHLKHMNHSKSFWNLVGTFEPYYKARTKWLKSNETIARILN